MQRQDNRHGWRRIVAAGIAGATAMLVVGGSQAAFAVPTPNSGPTAGGTTVTIEAPIQEYKVLSAGAGHSIGVTTDGKVWTWGLNLFGALGNGTTTNSSVPVQVMSLAGDSIVDVAGDRLASLAVSSSGAVWAWGYNASGQLGNGTTTNSTAPVQVIGLPPIKQISAREDSVFALAQDGTVWAWGDNSSGQLGTGVVGNSSVPIQVAGVSGIKQISAGYQQAVALTESGTVIAWGNNQYGQLGDGTTTSSASPVTVTGLTGLTVERVVAGMRMASAAVLSDGSVLTWGNNFNGQLGNGTTTNSSVPTSVQGLAGVNVVDIAIGAYWMIARAADGTAWSWGGNDSGQLGIGTNTNTTSATQVPGLTNITAISAGNLFSLAMSQHNAAWGAGLNSAGQLGNGTTTDSNVVVKVQNVVGLTVTGVTFDGLPGIALTVVDAGHISIVAPAHPAGPVDVVLTTQYADGSPGPVVTYSQGFTYVEPATPPVITTPSLPNGTTTVPYSATVEATGTATITFAVATGSLPPGLTLDPATGVISGTPMAVGSYVFTITATNAVGSDTHEYTVVIADSSTPTPTPTPTHSTVVPVTTGTPAGGVLALTGTNLTGPAIAGAAALLFILVGAASAVIIRRRRHATS